MEHSPCTSSLAHLATPLAPLLDHPATTPPLCQQPIYLRPLFHHTC
uniref:Uncharacterized protein n=1 Tax=Arundo donax TaxID=35708 RepID=A0A0A9BH04_ARUDO